MTQHGALLLGQARLVCKRVVDQRDQRMLRTDIQTSFGQNAEREAIDDDGVAAGQRHQQPARLGLRCIAWPRKTFTQCHDIDLPAERREFGDDASVISIAAGRGRKIARNRKGGPPHHNAASYQARATCDSEMVTRIALSSRPSRPSRSARAASASRSKTCLVRIRSWC